MRIVFSRHAEYKFVVLARHGWSIERHIIEEAVRSPAILDHSRRPLVIAQVALDVTHVLRVVYKQDNDAILIITFYPGRKFQYAKAQ